MIPTRPSVSMRTFSPVLLLNLKSFLHFKLAVPVKSLNSSVTSVSVLSNLAHSLVAPEFTWKFRDGEIRLEDGSLPQMDDNIQVVSGHLEMSNVNITEELVQSIEDQRQYEINIKLISSASEMDEGGATLMRMPS